MVVSGRSAAPVRPWPIVRRGVPAGPCRDELHRVFLHQAILSTLAAKLPDWERVWLPPPERRARKLNGLVNAVYEDAFPWSQIEVDKPLRSWLRERVPA
ncbi:MAG: hypothetical protein JW900_05330 [Anaerolineae bacterium]|nr:hypothetical protein [Anaerolineae bacterium]